MQRIAATALLTAGVFVLAGFGWALLAAGVLVGMMDARSVGWLVEQRDRGTVLARRLVATPRRSLAGGAMGVGLVAVPAGAVVDFGVGFGLLALGGLLIGFSLLSGWGA